MKDRNLSMTNNTNNDDAPGQSFVKGFDKNMQCRGFQYAEGETYEQEQEAILCGSGFHACALPLDVLTYYPLRDGNQYRVVDLEDSTEESVGDSKVSARKITVGARVEVFGLVKAHVEAIWNRVTDETDASEGVKATTGRWANAATTGDRAHAATTGDDAHAATTGGGANAVTTGYGAHAAATVTDPTAIAAVLGRGKAKGELRCWLVLTERDGYLNVLGVQAIQVDGETIKPGVYYTLKAGKIVEAE